MDVQIWEEGQQTGLEGDKGLRKEGKEEVVSPGSPGQGQGRGWSGWISALSTFLSAHSVHQPSSHKCQGH